ncbi:MULTISPECIES: PilZ domain-containing protein [unclassified Pseudoalteromonas]|uniref:PilZ domain-containing protein n=1 Tax=unclassified Pseudoalteromonas TaxID=194690 RepID=UPI00110B0DBB|nr:MULTISPECIES: PilZ domain-containing protein [unclassified Pseudoalteromonas]MBB1387113.1 PilZ domain-containing protein [Pseudoalteromonas sp. SG45-5]MBB1395216.1 PilZ domain-containing protein [Pseudoalteromonas sp. SG44-4]MBB1447264.1 PilZ domain-containing protein [Pseudoalteromonas sp. SG41-6]TMO01650.1 PilZ domain-containing protein [Pseudoalteromonas sp. S558]
MSSEFETKRNYKRWNLNPKDNFEPEAVQRGGVSVELLRNFFFDISICHAVAKDISLGGVGLLVPSEKTIPDTVTVVFDEHSRLVGKVMYRRKVNEKLAFLGVEWTTKNDKKRSTIVTRLQQQAQYKKEQRLK